MNNKRRAEVKRIMQKLKDDVYSLLDKAREELEIVRDDEQEAYDNLPESLQYSDKGEDMERCIEALDEMMDYLEYSCDLYDKVSELYSELDIENEGRINHT